MGELRGEGNNLIVALCRRHRKLSEAAGLEQSLYAIEHIEPPDVIHVIGRHHDHGGSLEHGGAGVGIACILGACHGVAAHEAPVMTSRDGKARLADPSLDARDVYDDGAR